MSYLRLKCTKFDFSWGSALDPTLRELTALPQIAYLDLKGPTAKGKGGRTGHEERGGFFLYV